MPAAQITVESSGGGVYRVVVYAGTQRTTHDVTVTPEDVARYAPGSTPERLLEASFEFLLEREPASSILSRFALPVIERYFPDIRASSAGWSETRCRESCGAIAERWSQPRDAVQPLDGSVDLGERSVSVAACRIPGERQSAREEQQRARLRNAGRDLGRPWASWGVVGVEVVTWKVAVPPDRMLICRVSSPPGATNQSMSSPFPANAIMRCRIEPAVVEGR